MATAANPQSTAEGSELTGDQRRWAIQFCELLDLRGENAEAVRQETYGSGMKDRGFATDPRDLPPKLTAALSSHPPKMVSAKDWNDSSRNPSSSEVSALLKDKNQLQSQLSGYATAKQNFDAAKKQSDHWYDVRSKLDAARKKIPLVDCDLRGIDPPNEVVPANQLEARFKSADDNWYEKVVARNQVEEQQVKPSREAASRCFVIVDAPANNPEREKVGKLLHELDALESRIGGKPLTADLAREKQAKLFEIEKTLFAWNDRRTQQNLPPASEAMMLSDMLQRVHQDVVSQVIDNGWPITVADSDRMSPEEDQRLQASWQSLVNSKNNPNAKIVIPETVGGKLDSPQKAKQFRLETLTNFSRLMGSEAGRHIVAELEKSPEQVTFEAGDEAMCISKVVSEATYDPSGTRTAKGQKRGARVQMVLGAKDSDVALNTPNGNTLFSPRFIAMGHELIHGLHGARGTDQSKKDAHLLPDAKWNNWEEYQTIRQGKTSEQTLRAQYGMSAERFGHLSSDPQQALPDAFGDSLEAFAELQQLQNSGTDVDGALKSRKLNPNAMTEKTKLALYKDSTVTGPIPGGWDANQLTVDQIKGIVTHKIPPRLGELGWAPYGLPVTGGGDSIKNLIDTSRHHPRSPLGRKYRSLGGDTAWQALADFEAGASSGLYLGSDANWPTKVEALDRAAAALDALASGITDPTFPNRYAAEKKVAGKIKLLKDAIQTAENTAQKKLQELANRATNKTQEGQLVATVDADLKDRNWGPALPRLNSRTKLALFQDKSVVGPLPAGWNANELSLDQIKGIVQDKIPFRLSELGWSPLELRDLSRLKLVTATSEAHPKSPPGTKFAILGGDAALQAIATFNREARARLPVGKPTDWPSRLEALSLAADRLKLLADNVFDTDLRAVVLSSAPIARRLEALKKGLADADAARAEAARKAESHAEQIVQSFDSGRVQQIATAGHAKGSRFEAVVLAMQEVSRLMVTSGSSPLNAEDVENALANLEAEAQKYLNEPAHKDPRSSEGKARVNECQKVLQQAQSARQQIVQINETADNLLQFVTSQLQQRTARPIPTEPLDKLLSTPLLSGDHRQAAVSLREEVDRYTRELLSV